MLDLCREVPPRLRIDARGAVVDIGDSPVKGFKPPRLWLDYAQALLRSDRDDLRFIWSGEPKEWVSVSLRAERSSLRGPSVELEYHQIPPPYGLSQRELDVLTLIAAGYGNEAIAEHLDISRRTVDKHAENISTKTETWTRAGLAGLAVDRGLMKLPLPGKSANFTQGIGALAAILRRPEAERPPIRSLAKRPICVGMPLPFESGGRADAIEMLNGAQLAVEQINRRGGVLDRELRLITADCNITDYRSVKRAVSELIDDEVDAITAGYSYADISVFEAASDYKAPFLHAATLDHVVNWVREDPGRFGNVFQTCASDINYGNGLARFLSWLAATSQWQPRNRRIAVIQPQWPGLNIGLSDLDLRLAGRGWEIHLVAACEAPDRSWSMVVEELSAFDPSVILFASYMVEDSIAFQKDFIKSPIDALVYKLYSPSVPVYRDTLGADADGVLWATTTGLYNDFFADAFRSDFQASYGRRPGRSHAGIAYDRINLLAGAWSRVGHARDFDRVVRDLRSSVYRGVNGSYYFGNQGQVGLAFPDDTADPSISQAHLVFQIQKGRHRIIAPEPYADGGFQEPQWRLTR